MTETKPTTAVEFAALAWSKLEERDAAAAVPLLRQALALIDPVTDESGVSRPVQSSRGEWYPSIQAASEAVGVTRNGVNVALSTGGRSAGRRWWYSEHPTREAWRAAKTESTKTEA